MDSAYITINVKKTRVAEVISPLQLAFFGHACPPEQLLDKRSHPVSNFTWQGTLKARKQFTTRFYFKSKD
ncbi:hypothetical protein [Paenibacillus polymyxa]|uniref:hypothetical protein n=1 Tax=Paenibacillus polymyxa TaxID=1406 RepID=UPI000A415274|nr:hypothetical protein [Paenibacillus polymyxa]